MSKHGKNYREAVALIEKENYGFEEAVTLLKQTSKVKFDATCEVHFNLGLDPKQAEENIRGTVALPHGTGNDVRVIAFVDDGGVKDAKTAGASEAGTNDLIEKIEGGWLEFDVAVADPSQMRSLGKIAKILGTKGLMPNPKAGTVTPDVAKTIEEIKKGRLEFRIDKLGNVHCSFGKVSFEEAALKENLLAVVKAIKEAKPSTVKGVYVKSITLTTSMGPGIRLENSSTLEAV
ncbi:50S ribosomal protein L1 [Candidatus Peregrinibacteria bacterium]|jgi:large subunit ribosomal protein L1|nr:50S ribosomal protein L1 [Candidatus Peregrinibacteria bacterium]MBT4055494.1 50S ribosomal protein L1 [Candidatus Peregrinibacteria bacterium]